MNRSLSRDILQLIFEQIDDSETWVALSTCSKYAFHLSKSLLQTKQGNWQVVPNRWLTVLTCKFDTILPCGVKHGNSIRTEVTDDDNIMFIEVRRYISGKKTRVFYEWYMMAYRVYKWINVSGKDEEETGIRVKVHDWYGSDEDLACWYGDDLSINCGHLEFKVTPTNIWYCELTEHTLHQILPVKSIDNIKKLST